MKIKKKHLYLSITIIAVVLLVLFTNIKCVVPVLKNSCISEEKTTVAEDTIKKDWNLDENGFLSFASPRDEILFARENHSETSDLYISKITFKSNGADIYGLLVLPKKTEQSLPGIVLIPGAGVSKESELALAKNISSLGIAVLTYDQRGVGETKSSGTDIQEQFQLLERGIEPEGYEMIFDALRAFDVLASAPFVNADMVIMAGESFGGRNALIATALEPKITGALIISSSGFDLGLGQNTDADRFLISLDPDHYISRISPRKIVFMHNEQDKNVPIGAAARTYNKAADPKRFVLVNDTTCNHGYCESMNPGMRAGLQFLYG